MKAYIDGDILRYEIGFAAETGWKAITGREDEVPPFKYVEELLTQRIASILSQTKAEEYSLYITEGPTFRYNIAKTKPYKGNRVQNKPYHFDNITAYIKGMLPHKICKELEADDWMAIDAGIEINNTIICSRDKDLKQITGNFYSWELGNQPSFGPTYITNPGSLELSRKRKALKGTGYAFFASQLLTGDRVDNVPGAKGMGPVSVYEIIKPILDMEHTDYVCKSIEDSVISVYKEIYGQDAEEMLTEQGRLLWVVKRLNQDGTPELWHKGLYQ